MTSLWSNKKTQPKCPLYPQIVHPISFSSRMKMDKLHNALLGNFKMKDVVTDIIGWL